MAESPTPEELGAYVDETAKRVGLPHRAGAPAGRDPVHRGRCSPQAALVMEFPLPDEVEPAPVFRP